MRKQLFCLTLLFTGALIGAPVLSPPAPACGLFGIGPANNIVIQYDVWSSPSFFCQQEDKIYSNFEVFGLPTNTILQLQQQTLGMVDFHIVTFNGNFLAPFVVSYDIAIDLTMDPWKRIVRVSGDLSNPTRIGTPESAKLVYTSPGGVFLGSISSVPLNPGAPLIVEESALHVVDLYTPAGGGAVSLSNTFAQATVPEPATYLSIGAGLVLLFWKRSTNVAARRG